MHIIYYQNACPWNFYFILAMYIISRKDQLSSPYKNPDFQY